MTMKKKETFRFSVPGTVNDLATDNRDILATGEP
jgi:hypothetical protein